jgi:hypothetical protein
MDIYIYIYIYIYISCGMNNAIHLSSKTHFMHTCFHVHAGKKRCVERSNLRLQTAVMHRKTLVKNLNLLRELLRFA